MHPLISYSNVLKVRKIKVVDFIANLSRVQPVEIDEIEAIRNWYCKTPLGKQFINIRKKPEETGSK